MWKFLKIPISLIISISILAVPVAGYSMEDDYEIGQQDGMARGEKAGEGMYFWIGCLYGLLGLMLATVIEPYIPTDELIGKSPSYIVGYTEGYRKKAKSANFNKALIGCIVSSGVILVAEVGTFMLLYSFYYGW